MAFYLTVPSFFPCHTERSEVSIKSKRVLKSVDISLTLNMTIWIFLLRLAPCNPLGRYAQNDKILKNLNKFKNSNKILKI